MKKFKLILGDWSHDGHGITEVILFNTNLSIEELRELYFNQCSKYGKILENLCSEYEDCSINKEQFITIENYGFKFSEDIKQEIQDDEVAYIDSDLFVDIFIWFMKKDNPNLILDIIDDNVPSFHFYGFDDKKRHIQFFGYGLFS